MQKLRVSRTLINDILSWIKSGATKDTKGKNYSEETGTILSKLKAYAKIEGLSFKQNMMVPLFSIDISSFTDYKTLQEAYDEKHNSLPPVIGFELDFDDVPLTPIVEEEGPVETKPYTELRIEQEDVYEPHLDELEERKFI